MQANVAPACSSSPTAPRRPLLGPLGAVAAVSGAAGRGPSPQVVEILDLLRARRWEEARVANDLLGAELDGKVRRPVARLRALRRGHRPNLDDVTGPDRAFVRRAAGVVLRRASTILDGMALDDEHRGAATRIMAKALDGAWLPEGVSFAALAAGIVAYGDELVVPNPAVAADLRERANDLSVLVRDLALLDLGRLDELETTTAAPVENVRETFAPNRARAGGPDSNQETVREREPRANAPERRIEPIDQAIACASSGLAPAPAAPALDGEGGGATQEAERPVEAQLPLVGWRPVVVVSLETTTFKRVTDTPDTPAPRRADGRGKTPNPTPKGKTRRAESNSPDALPRISMFGRMVAEARRLVESGAVRLREDVPLPVLHEARQHAPLVLAFLLASRTMRPDAPAFIKAPAWQAATGCTPKAFTAVLAWGADVGAIRFLRGENGRTCGMELVEGVLVSGAAPAAVEAAS